MGFGIERILNEAKQISNNFFLFERLFGNEPNRLIDVYSC